MTMTLHQLGKIIQEEVAPGTRGGGGMEEHDKIMTKGEGPKIIR